MSRALWFLLETLGSLLATACVLRAAAMRFQLPPRNPISQFVIAVTDWLVRPLRRLLPVTRGTDWASLGAALVVALALAMVWAVLYGRGSDPMWGAVIPLALFWLVKWSIYLLMGLVLLHAILSWVNPDAPIAPTLELLTRPFLAPVRRVVPLIGGVDLSPLILLVLAQLVMTLFEQLFVSLVSSF